MKTTLSRLAIAVSVAFVSTAALADGHKVEMNGAAGFYDFDSNRNIDNAAFGGVGLGYVVNPNWTAELWYSESNTDVDGANTGIDADEVRLDALYNLPAIGSWKPYLVAGVGEMSYDIENAKEVDETRVNIGAGVKRALTDRLNLRGDVRLFNSLDEEQTDYGVQVGLNYALGKAAAKPAPAAEPAPVAVDGDDDGDGVRNSVDKCPGTAANLKVDADGCPMKLTETVNIDLKVNFDHDSSVVKPAYFAEIKRVADFMAQYEGTQVQIQGHTDSSGSDAYNQKLSQRRAEAVAAVLVNQHGVAADRVSSVGYGESKPVASNATADGRATNRRVVAAVSTKVERLQQR